MCRLEARLLPLRGRPCRHGALARISVDERQHGPLELEPQLRLGVNDRRRTETEIGRAHGYISKACCGIRRMACGQ